MAYTRNTVVKQAKAWLGYKESDDTYKEIIDIYNAHTPLARGYKVQYTDAWCATFVSAVAIKCGYTDIMPTECSCDKMITLYKNLGCWEEDDSYTPSAGDVIFYDWQDTTGSSSDNTATPDHVGIVEKVSGSTITVIEGNYSDSVKRRTIKVNGTYIRGYGLPNYSGSTTSSSTTSSTAQSDVTATDKAQSYDKTVAGTYSVTAVSGLNVRDGASTSKTILTTISYGTQVKNYGYYTTNNGTKWLYVQFTQNSKTYTGFCDSDYLSKT